MGSSFEIEAREALADRLTGARHDIRGVIRAIDCCPHPATVPALPLLLAACDCLDEAIVRVGGGDSAALDEPVDDRQ
jgi:hypothetical protein